MISKETQVDNHIQLVTFQLGEELYGVDIMQVKEIVRLQEVRSIPNSPEYVEGILNLRKEIIPIINLHKRFHLQKANKIDDDEEYLGGFIILNIQNSKIGIIIDRISRVVMIDKGEIQPPPQMLTGIGAEYITGVSRLESGYLIILDVDRLFNSKELQKIVQINK